MCVLIYSFGGSFSYIKINVPRPPRPTKVTANLKPYLSKYLVLTKNESNT